MLLLTAAIAFVMVAVKACVEQIKEPYNKEYRPLDVPSGLSGDGK